MARKTGNKRDRRERPQIKVRNPRYKGATPEDVGKALLQLRDDRRKDDGDDEDGEDGDC